MIGYDENRASITVSGGAAVASVLRQEVK